jgi:peptidoglycan/LPS O-acetylase OafA/YrhL
MLLDYRRDIDGLRAIAVLLVVLFHLGMPITGGFIGVDIFFVISGFLIASLIQKQILRDKFTFKGFYLHRMRRILPALLTVIAVTTAIAWFIVLPKDFIFYIKTLSYALIGFSNIYFYDKGQDYFAANTDNLQMLHTWSLGVEEQFYFIAPIFLIFLFKFFYNTKWFNIILATLVVVGLGVSHYYAMNNQAGAYYLLPARFFELLMGVVLALNYSKLPISKDKCINNMLAVLALALILIPAFLITKQDVFPSYNALFVCLGSCLIIYLGKAEKATFVTKLLSIKPLVFIGLISYSLYLWHWPIISFFNLVDVELNTISQLALLVLFIILAYLSWKFVEQPFRNKFKWSFRKTLLILLLIPMIIFTAAKIVVEKNDGLVDLRFAGNTYATSVSSEAKNEKNLCLANLMKQRGKDREYCSIGNREKQSFDALLYGDSHSNSMGGFIEYLFEQEGLKATVKSDSSKFYLKGIDQHLDKLKYPDRMEFVIKGIEDDLRNNNYNYVIISASFGSYLRDLGQDLYAKLFDDTIAYIISRGAIPVIIEDIPKITDQLAYCPTYKNQFNLDKNCNILFADVKAKQAEETQVFEQLKSKYKQIIFIDPKNILCDETTCYTSLDGLSMYIDNNHISYVGSRHLAKLYAQKYGNPFKQ